MSKKTGRPVRLNHLSLSLEQAAAGELSALAALASRRLRGPVTQVELVRKSLDAREKGKPAFIYTVDVSGPGPLRGETPPSAAELAVQDFHTWSGLRPVVVGAGPAGLFAGLLLALSGLRPLILEQGQPVEERSLAVSRFWQQGKLEPSSNIQFGEGGAGAFSDGKLTSRGKDSRCGLVLRILAECGANPSITYWHKPHIGSDALPQVVAALRRRIQAAGGEFRFGRPVTQLHIVNHTLQGLTAGGEELAAERVILAIGNGARPLYRLLAEQGVALSAKPFAVGLRIRHAQSLIDQAQYGVSAGHPLLGPADYQLTWQDTQQQRGCYTFCNCPGGDIVDASSELGALVVNGVSDSARSGPWANAAVVAQVSPGRDFGSDTLDGLEFQQRLEKGAWQAAAGAVPVMSTTAFLGGEPEPWEPGGIRAAAVAQAELRQLLPEDVVASLCGAISHWQRQIPGFAQGLLAAVETRTSAPLRILRGEDGVSLNCRGLYPAGEGAGYAGGIVSSAADGLRAAEALLETVSNC